MFWVQQEKHVRPAQRNGHHGNANGALRGEFRVEFAESPKHMSKYCGYIRYHEQTQNGLQTKNELLRGYA